MLKYTLKRLLQMIPVLFVVSILIFAMVRIVPTDPIASITKGKHVSETTKQQLREEFYLDRTPLAQYGIWMGGLLRGDLGQSYSHRAPVSYLIGERIGVTLSLVALAGAMAIVLAIPIGVISAVKMNTFVDKLLSFLSLLFVASPVFLTAMVLMLIFALRLGLFPTMGTGSFRHLILPAAALALNMIALTSRITRSTMIEELNSDYIRTATAKGIPRGRVIVVHALKNALIPVITVTSVQIGGMLIGSVLVETVFAMGGLGGLLIPAISASDYPLVQGITMLLVTVFLALNLLVDILYAILDPRIRLT